MLCLIFSISAAHIIQGILSQLSSSDPVLTGGVSVKSHNKKLTGEVCQSLGASTVF